MIFTVNDIDLKGCSIINDNALDFTDVMTLSPLLSPPSIAPEYAIVLCAAHRAAYGL